MVILITFNQQSVTACCHAREAKAMHGTPSSPRSPLYKAYLFPFLCLLLQQQRPVTLLNDLTPNTSISMGACRLLSAAWGSIDIHTGLFDFFNNDPSGRDEV